MFDIRIMIWKFVGLISKRCIEVSSSYLFNILTVVMQSATYNDSTGIPNLVKSVFNS